MTDALLRRLTKYVQVGNTVFHPGVPERMVIERAEREYEYQQTPEREAERAQRRHTFSLEIAQAVEESKEDVPLTHWQALPNPTSKQPGEAQRDGRNELYWLIELREHPRPGQYLVRERYGAVDWSDDPQLAMKFQDEAMAKRFVAGTILRVYNVEVCEHMNCGGPASL